MMPENHAASTPSSSLFAFHPYQPRYAVLERFAAEDAELDDDDDDGGGGGGGGESTTSRLQQALVRLAAWATGDVSRLRSRRPPLDDYEQYLPRLKFFAVAAPGSAGAAASPLVLRHDFMREVSSMAWSPLSEMVAVGAAHGVCLLRIFEDESDPDPALTTGWMGFLQHPRLLAIRDLSWSPSGRLLATASPGDAALLVWDVALRTCKFVWAPRPPVAVEWSPMGGHLFAAFEGGAFAIWETARWNMELFEFPGRFCAAAWAPDGLRLAIVMDHLEENDRCWFDATEDGDGAPPTWIPATFCGDVGGPLLGGALVGTGGGGGGGGGVAAAAAAAAAAAVAAAGAAGGGFRGQQAGQREREREQVRVRVDDELGNPGEVEVVDRARVHGDKPVFVGTLQGREDVAEFLVSFEAAHLPAAQDVSSAAAMRGFEDASSGAGAPPPLPTSAIRGLAWSSDGAVLLASFFLRRHAVGALAAYTLRHEPLSLAPLQLVDMKYNTAQPPQSVSFWSGSVHGSSRLLLGAAWPERDGVLMYDIPAPK